MDAVASKVGEFQGSDKGLVGSNKVRVGKKADAFLRIEAYTAGAEWLDVVELHASDVGGGRVRVRIKSFSSGFCPTTMPCSLLLSAAFFFFPFSDQTPEVCCLGWMDGCRAQLPAAKPGGWGGEREREREEEEERGREGETDRRASPFFARRLSLSLPLDWRRSGRHAHISFALLLNAVPREKKRKRVEKR